MEKKELLYEGKAKKVYKTADEDRFIVMFKDDATAFNGKKKGQIQRKGIMNTAITKIFFELLEEKGIPTHFIELVSDNEILVRGLEIFKIEVVMRNIAAGSISKRLGLEEGTILKKPVLEFYYKDDELGDPMINEYHIFAEELATEEELNTIKKMAFEINDILRDFLKKRGIELVDFKLEFGKDKAGRIYLADEISPDTCRFWDISSKEKLDKDRFRQDLGNVEDAYQEILSRIEK
ncbi:MAG: phosphoribosylaminoimidazolesuccinocarboxamide synthase [Halanaerobiaceae bacterium]|nr:phosphoribosylaminoimidazolesuccinocarboxamide synthase [Halanaerobiaceae bacterium]